MRQSAPAVAQSQDPDPQPEPETRMKRCPRCGVFKPLSEWVKDRSQASGIGCCCRPCKHPKQKRASVPTAKRFWTKVRLADEDECWEWTGAMIRGYGALRRYRNGLVLAHRLSWEIHNGPVPPGLLVLHKCDNPACVRPDHLFLGTHADKSRDMIAKGRGYPARGERIASAKLTEADVREIRQAVADGSATVVAMAERFSVHRWTIRRVVDRLSWQHVA